MKLLLLLGYKILRVKSHRGLTTDYRLHIRLTADKGEILPTQFRDDQHMEPFKCCWFSKLEFPLQISGTHDWHQSFTLGEIYPSQGIETVSHSKVRIENNMP